MATNRNRKFNKSKANTKKKGRDDCTDSTEEQGTGRKDFGKFRKSKENSWQWYAQNEQLLKDSASFSYNYPLGTTVTITDNSSDPINTAAVPGVMAIYCSPSYGGSSVANSPLNVAIRNIYSFVRHANSGHTNYDAPDLGIYLMAMDNLYSYISFLRRIYGVVMTFSYTNRYYPTAVVNAMGVDFEDIHQNLADFRAYINSLAVKVGSMCVPASMSVFARHMWMYEGYYVDTDQDKAQTFLYSPSGFFTYTLNTDQSGMLVYKPLLDADNYVASAAFNDMKLLTFQKLHDYGDAMIEPILRSEDMNIMSGDVLKAFGRENVYMLPMIPENYVVLPSFNEEVVDQMNNATLVGVRSRGSVNLDGFNTSNSLVQDPTHGYLCENISCSIVNTDMTTATVKSVNVGALSSKKYINFDHGDISPADSMVASRLTNIIPSKYINLSGTVYIGLGDGQEYPAIQWSSTQEEYMLQQDCTLGTDVAHFANIYYYGSNALIRSEMIMCVLPVIIGLDSVNQSTVTALVNNIQYDTARINMLTNFRRHPRVAYQYVLYAPDDVTGLLYAGGGYVANIGDLNYWTVVDSYDLKGMAETALLSEFNVTQFGRRQ